IASRCARLATSGTTPPNLACSSTLLAIAFASNVVPRTMPTPVSSHDVSMPSTNGSSVTGATCRCPLGDVDAGEVEYHEHGVGATGLVVALAKAHLHKAEPLIQPLGTLVV